MSRLDSFIRRITAQRNVLNWATNDIKDLAGPALELGLGNGRTFDHLRERLPERRIIAFDRACAAHRQSTPAAGDLVLGDIRETAAKLVGIEAALVHADIGTGYEDLDLLTLAWLPNLTASLLRPRGIAASGLPLDHPALSPLALPPMVSKHRYFLYRRL
jgi:S-adenosyl-L-methionine methyltransferase